MRISRREQFLACALSSDLTDCVAWPFAVRKSSGYPAHSYSEHGRKFNVDAHRYVCERAHGNAPSLLHQAAHECGSRLCVNPKHLRWATPKANMEDAKRHGSLRGGGRGRQRLFAREIADICSAKASLSALSAKYGMDVAYIGRVKRRGLAA